MNHEISRYTKLNPKALDFLHYTQSLINESARLGLLSGSDVERIQLALLNLLAEQIQLYTNGQSCSVKEETAQSLFSCIFYCTDAFLLSQPPADAADCLCKAVSDAEVRDIFSKGKELIKSNFADAKCLLQRAYDERLKVELIAYNNTLDCAMPEFFDSYNVNFAPQDGSGLIDYPLSEDNMKISGIRYILNYLKTFLLENDICRCFSNRDINLLLERYGKTYHYDYRDMLINIFELVLTNSICAVLLGKSAKILLIAKKDCQQLTDQIGSAAVMSAAGHVCRELELTEDQCEYVKRCAKRLIPGFLLAAQNGNMDKLTSTC